MTRALPVRVRLLTGGAAAGMILGGLSGAAPPPATAATATGSGATAGHCTSTPFRSSPSIKRWYRIPAVVRTNSGALVAFAERRDNDTIDDGNFDVVSTRSTDGGCTWSPVTVIGNDAANRVSNPVPIVDRTTGKVLLLSVVTARPGSGGRGKGLYLQTSSDDGRTFSSLLARPLRPAGSYKGGLTGPAHGIQLSVRRPGRLLFAMGYRTSAGLYGAYGIYSDDHGATWRTGFDQQDTSGAVDYMEGTIAELADGDLVISYRLKKEAATAGTARRYAVSKDGGATLSTRFGALSLKIVSVQGSLLAPRGSYGNLLLFSAPADRTPTLRRRMTIFGSWTRGVTWTKQFPVELEDKPGSYSDLVMVDPKRVGIIFETGDVTWRERISFASFLVGTVLDPPKVASSLTGYRSSARTTTADQARVQATVGVRGISSPPGRVTLSWSGAAGSGSVHVDLTYSNRGVRWLTLPRLKRGSYRLTLSYSGTVRIQGRSVSMGTLTIS